MDLVPVVDIANPAATSIEALDRACRDHGFFLLSGHGLDGVIDDTFKAAKRFFDAPHEVKSQIRRSADNPLGYNERELTKRVRDHKEVFDFVDPWRAGPFVTTAGPTSPSWASFRTSWPRTTTRAAILPSAPRLWCSLRSD